MEKPPCEGHDRRPYVLPQPPPVFVAMVLLALLSLTNLVPAQSVILEGNPMAAVFLPLVMGVLGLVGAWGLWMLKRWAMWLVIVVCGLNILMTAPELISPFMAIYAAIYIVVCALVILLAVLPSSRRAYT
jgi:uncharacterized membrane protein (DUF2068 family)